MSYGEFLGTFMDPDGTIKNVFKFNGKNIIEMSLLVNKEDRDVICVPSHYFCGLGCKMCHLTNSQLSKEMLPIGIDNFMYSLENTICFQNGTKRTYKDKLLISFMGVGDPLLNLDLIENLYKRESYLKEKYGYKEIGYSLCTMMPNNNMIKIFDMVDRLRIPLKVHFSLHSPIEDIRDNLIPNSCVCIEQALIYLDQYRKYFQGLDDVKCKYLKMHNDVLPVEIHYTLIDGVNDSDLELIKLNELEGKYNIPLKFIKFNEINNLRKSSKEDIWVDFLKENNPDLKLKIYSPPGREIGSSCGEFTKHYYHEEIETEKEYQDFIKWKKLYQVR